MLICIEIPIPDYYGEDIYEQQLFFNVSHGSKLTKDFVLSEVQKLNDRDSQYPEYTGDWNQVKDSILGVGEWRYINNNLVRTSSHTKVTLPNSKNLNGVRETEIISAALTWKLINAIEVP